MCVCAHARVLLSIIAFLCTETVTMIMMLYKNTKSVVRPPDGDTDSFDTVTGVF